MYLSWTMNLMRICSIYYKVLKTVRIIVVCQNIIFEQNTQKKNFVLWKYDRLD